MNTLKRILIVEGESQDIDRCLKVFGGFQTSQEVIGNGREAYDLLFNSGPETPLPELILLGLRLPEMDGLQLLRAIRASRRTANIPVVFLINSIHEKDLLESCTRGRSAYLLRPLSYARLVYALLTLGLTLTDGFLHSREAFEQSVA